MEYSQIDKFENIVIKNISNEHFGAAELAEFAGLSRYRVYRIIQNEKGLSTSKFIKKIRLKKAIDLLKNTDLSFAEISYQVGFGSPSYFTKCFNEHFGITPSEMKRRMTESQNKSHLENRWRSIKRVLISRKYWYFKSIFLLVFIAILYIFWAFYMM